jgi:NADH-quinone oxidoreductase subunit J
MPAAVLAASSMHTSGAEAAIFWICAPLAIVAALGMVFSRNVVHSALMLGGVMLLLAIFYAAQDAPFIAFVQVIVYTGAVMMLFLFVLMLVGVDSRERLIETLQGQRLATATAGIGFLVLLFTGIAHAAIHTSAGLGNVNYPTNPDTGTVETGGNIYQIAKLLFTRYVFAFEVTSALLITAALGAMVLAHRERHEPKKTQGELMRERFKSGAHPTPLPGPGVYARHNAVDTPALLPDGSMAELSVPDPIREISEVHGRRPQPSELSASATVAHPSSGKGQEDS